MDANSQTAGPRPAHKLAVASAAFAVLALPLSVFCGLGLPAALLALTLAIAYARRAGSNPGYRRLLAGMSCFSLCWSLLFLWAWYAGSKQRQASQAAFLEQLPRWRGVVAPPAGFRLLDDRRIQLADFRGRNVLVTFWRTDVPPCLVMATNLIRLRRAVAASELAIVAVSIERPDPLKRFVEKLGVNYDVCWLGRIDAPPPPFDRILGVPVTFFIGRNGVIRDVLNGSPDSAVLQEKALEPDWTGPTNAPPPFPPP